MKWYYFCTLLMMHNAVNADNKVFLEPSLAQLNAIYNEEDTQFIQEPADSDYTNDQDA